MSNYVTVGSAIRSRFSTEWGSTTDIAWPNSGYEPTQGTTWVRFTIRDASARQLALLGQRRAIGVVLIDIYTAPKIGDGTARGHADTICGIFRRVTVSGIRFREPEAREAVTQEPGWYRWIVEIPFEADSDP